VYVCPSIRRIGGASAEHDDCVCLSGGEFLLRQYFLRTRSVDFLRLLVVEKVTNETILNRCEHFLETARLGSFQICVPRYFLFAFSNSLLFA